MKPLEEAAEALKLAAEAVRRIQVVPSSAAFSSDVVSEILERLERLEAKIDSFTPHSPAKEFYTLPEFAEIMGRSVDRVRKLCQRGRLAAVKSEGRGETGSSAKPGFGVCTNYNWCDTSPECGSSPTEKLT